MKCPALLLLLPALVAAQDKAIDPEGWTRAKWGMTEAQLKEAFSDAQYIVRHSRFGDDVSPPSEPQLVLQHYEIGKLKYLVTFYFEEKEHKKGGLIEVALEPEEDHLPGVNATVAKSFLLDMLRDKYGEPSSAGSKPNGLTVLVGTNWQWKWLLPRTGVELYYHETRQMSYRTTILQYRKRVTSDQL